MGMFDDIEVEYTTDEIDLRGQDFQTKSLESLLLRFKISNSGELLVDADEGWQPYRTAPAGKPYEGTVTFYDFRDGQRGSWVEYEADFKEGSVTELRDVTEEARKRFATGNALYELSKGRDKGVTLTGAEATLLHDYIRKLWDDEEKLRKELDSARA